MKPRMRIGPLFLLVGGLAALGAGAAHGDLPERSGTAAIQFVADHPAYAAVHLVSILGAVLWALGLNGAYRPSTAAGNWLARAAGHVALIGAAVLAVQFSLDGIGMEALADLQSEPGASDAVLEAIAEIGPEFLIGPALAWVVLLYGLAPVLAGASLLTDDHRVLGWSGLALGVFSLAGGLALAMRVGVIPDWLVFAGSTIGVNLWVVALGTVLLRSAPVTVPPGPTS